MDVTRELDSVERIVSRGSLENRALRLARRFPAPVAEVWRVITEPDEISAWLVPISGDLRVGGRYQLEGNAGGEILSCEAPHRLSVTWEYDGEITRVDVRLVDEGAATLAELIHTGAHDPAKWAAYGPGAVGIGWELALLGLATRFDSCDTRALGTTLEGQESIEFVSCSGAAWGEAAALTGEDADLASEAARRCVAAYTGSVAPG